MAPMTLKLIKDGVFQDSPPKNLLDFCEEQKLDVTFEWINGQYWLHSDKEGERPIGIEIDAELSRHQEYFKKSSLQKDLLAKAIGVKGPHRPSVTDLTAGMLGDTLLFLSFGCQVISVERNPLISFLIESARANAKHDSLQRWTFIHADAQEILDAGVNTEVIYFDPMFEDFNEKSSPRKEMRIFRHFIGQDMDATAVFEQARKLSIKRFVVKRPRLSKKLGSEEPLTYMGKATRYDVYLSQNHGLLKTDHLK